MNSKIKYTILGVLLATMLVYWNNEIYEHRTHMEKAEELYAKGKYGHSLDELKKANQFPFHLKTQKYITYMETKKQKDMYEYKTKVMKESKALEEYVAWVESTVFSQTTNGFASYGESLTHAEMGNMFYKLNFEAQDQKIKLSANLMDLHNILIEYLNKNQLAYSTWDKGEGIEAEKLRQEAISLHTDFMMEFNKLSKDVCGGRLELNHHLY